MATYLDSELFSVGFKDQTAYDAPAATGTAASWSWLDCEFPDISPAREIEVLTLSAGQDMAAAARKVGSKHGGTLTFRMPLRSQLLSHDGTVDTLTVNPEMQLLEDAIGSSVTGSFHSSAIIATGTDANTWELTSTATPSLDVGSGYMTGTSNQINSMGWVQSQSGTTVTMTQDGRAVPAAGDDIYPTVTLHPSAGVQPTPKTFRLVGHDSTHDVRMVGCMPTRAVISLNSGDVPTCEFTYVFTDIIYDSSGGIEASTDYQRLPPIMGVSGGRMLIGANFQADWNDGAADPEGSCGVSNLSLTIEPIFRTIRCHGGAQGVSDMYVARRRASVSFSMPHTADSVLPGVGPLPELSLAMGMPLSVTIEAGNRAGNCFGVNMPAGIVSEQWGYSPEDGVASFSVTGEAGEYSGDGASTGAGNSALRVCFG